MTDGLDPSGPAQPSLAQAYTTPGNPAQSDPSEQRDRAYNSAASKSENVPTTDKRSPSEQKNPFSDATPSSLGLGKQGAGPGEEAEGKTEEDVGRHRELEGEQMAAPGEGRVASAVKGETKAKSGASGQEQDMASDLERKKAEQAPLREAKKAEHEHDVDVAGALGQRGGPANPVGQNNYPNTGSS